MIALFLLLLPHCLAATDDNDAGGEIRIELGIKPLELQQPVMRLDAKTARFVKFEEQQLASSCQTLTGTWIDELGSLADVNSHTKSGWLSGTFASAVGAVRTPQPLVGSFERGVCHPTFGFVVAWPGANSTTAWSGALVNGTLRTTWLLTVRNAASADEWQATHVGSSVFYRT